MEGRQEGAREALAFAFAFAFIFDTVQRCAGSKREKCATVLYVWQRADMIVV